MFSFSRYRPSETGVTAIEHTEGVKIAKDQNEAKAAMIKAYPDWLNTDFLLVQSIEFQTGLLEKE